MAIFHFKYGKMNNYVLANTASIIIQILGILVIYYITKYILKVENTVIHISSLYFSIIMSEVIEHYIISKLKQNKFKNVHSIIIVIIMTVLFIVFTYLPPKLELFRDPISSSYGIKKLEE